MYKTVEMPLAGHPDKICDQIVEALVDEYLRRDEKSRANIQALGSHGMMMIGGTVDSRADFNAADFVQSIYASCGYKDEIEPFVNIEKPGEDLARILVKGASQSTASVYGYATKETREFLPKSVVYAHDLAKRIDDLRRSDESFSWLGPDGSVQITMDKDRPVSVAIAAQHHADMDHAQIQMGLLDAAIIPVLGNHSGIKLFVNSAGMFTDGGFMASVGASSGKVQASTYGGLLPSGLSSFFGKDPYQPSKCGTYMARFIAKSLVSSGQVGNALVKLVYVMGQPEPILVEAISGSGEQLQEKVKEYDLRPEAIVERFGLTKPLYHSLSTYNMFVREDAPWEQV